MRNSIYHPRNLQLLKELQFEYSSENKIHQLIAEMIKDVEARAPRKEIRADAQAILDATHDDGRHKLTRPSTAHNFLSMYLRMRTKRK